MLFDILGAITNIETIAIGNSIRDITRLAHNMTLDGGVNSKGRQRCAYRMVPFGQQKFIGMKLMESVVDGSKLNASWIN